MILAKTDKNFKKKLWSNSQTNEIQSKTDKKRIVLENLLKPKIKIDGNEINESTENEANINLKKEIVILNKKFKNTIDLIHL